MTVRTVHPMRRTPRVTYALSRMRARSGWMFVVHTRVDGVLMDHYAAIMDDFGALVRIDIRTTPPHVLRPGDGS